MGEQKNLHIKLLAKEENKDPLRLENLGLHRKKTRVDKISSKRWLK